jgi:diguanylate cyclase (GGDEF)-like protein
LLAGVLLCAPVFISANDDIQNRLNLAEQSRTSSPLQSQQIIDELTLQTDQMSLQQMHQLTFIKAYLFAIKGELDAAIELAKSLDNSPFIDSKIKANLLLANMYEAIKQHQLAYSYLYKALLDAKNNADDMLRANVYTVATQLHISAGVYDKALQYARRIAEVSNSVRHKCISDVLQIHALIRLNNSYPDEILVNAKEACRQANEPLMSHTLDQFKAEVDIHSAPAAVKASMLKMLPELEQIGFPYAILRSRYHLGYAQLQLNELSAAREELLKVQQLAIRLRDSRIENEALLLLARLHEKTGDTPAAVAAYKQHIAALNTYINEYKQRSVAYHLAQADFMESENKLALLQSQNELLQLESKLQKDEKLRTLLISIALLVLLLLVIYVLNSKRAALNRLATTDFLTRLFNRRYFNEAVSKHIANRRQQDEYSLIMFDIDLFKQINDQYGHAAGDKVLSAIARCCQAQIRQQDILARIGGEEFALFLPGCALADAKAIAEQCRQSLEQLNIEVDEQIIQVTASFGVATSHSADFNHLLKQADDALYQAKTGGRNRIRVHNSATGTGANGD